MGGTLGANIVIKILANAGALWAADRYITGLAVFPTEFFRFDFFAIPPLIQTLAIGGAALAAANAILRPPLSVIAAVLPFITTPMLMVVANVVLIYLAAAYFPATLAVAALKPLLFSGLILGLVNSLL